MSSITGNRLKISIFGQSHSGGIGVVIDGLPAGKTLDMDAIVTHMSRRVPGQNELSTPRKEEDMPVILSGLDYKGRTCGSPLCAVIYNKDTRSGDYSEIARKPRPSHADYPAFVKYEGAHDIRGGGHFSGRLTAPLCFAGAVAMGILEEYEIYVGAHIASIGTVDDVTFDPVHLAKEALFAPGQKPFPVISDERGQKMQEEILAAKAEHDSIGGVVECAAIGLPVGLGRPNFDGVENVIAKLVFGIPAVKGLEFGSGFQGSKMRGSQNNDPYFYDKNGRVFTKTNHHGGSLGGLTTGMPLIFRAAFKPTASIGIEQPTVDLTTGEETMLAVAGRHDPCIVPRAVPAVEAAAAIGILDLLLEQ